MKPTIPQPLPRNMIADLVRKVKTNYKEVVSIFLFGSIAEGTWTNSSDLDVEVIVDFAEGVDSRPAPFVLKGVPIELHVHPRDRFEEAEEVAGTSGFGSHIMNSIIIYDPTDFFNSVKTRIAKIYFTTPFIQKRVHNCLNIARNYVRNAEKFLSEGKLEFVPASIHRAINSGIAMALFHVKKSNPTQRRCLDKLGSILTEPKEHDLYLRIVDLLNLNNATFDSASKAIAEGNKFHTIVFLYLKRKGGCLWGKNKHWYNAITRRYIIEGARELLEERKYPASIFCTMMLANSPEIYDQLMSCFTNKHRKETLRLLRQIFQFEGAQEAMASKKCQEARSIMNSIRTLELSTAQIT